MEQVQNPYCGENRIDLLNKLIPANSKPQIVTSSVNKTKGYRIIEDLETEQPYRLESESSSGSRVKFFQKPPWIGEKLLALKILTEEALNQPRNPKSATKCLVM
ncbi:MAG: hypothetical protein GKR77_03985 [Legionellales bacterium]|nr:hypothetical protein [Legionellales bacterium]